MRRLPHLVSAGRSFLFTGYFPQPHTTMLRRGEYSWTVSYPENHNSMLRFALQLVRHTHANRGGGAFKWGAGPLKSLIFGHISSPKVAGLDLGAEGTRTKILPFPHSQLVPGILAQPTQGCSAPTPPGPRQCHMAATFGLPLSQRGTPETAEVLWPICLIPLPTPVVAACNLISWDMPQSVS